MGKDKFRKIREEINKFKDSSNEKCINILFARIDKNDFKNYLSTPCNILSFLSAIDDEKIRKLCEIKIRCLIPNDFKYIAQVTYVVNQVDDILNIPSVKKIVSQPFNYNQAFEEKIAYHYISVTESRAMLRCIKEEKKLEDDYFKNHPIPHLTELGCLMASINSSKSPLPLEITCYIASFLIKDVYGIDISKKLPDIINHTWSHLFCDERKQTANLSR